MTWGKKEGSWVPGCLGPHARSHRWCGPGRVTSLLGTSVFSSIIWELDILVYATPYCPKNLLFFWVIIIIICLFSFLPFLNFPPLFPFFSPFFLPFFPLFSPFFPLLISLSLPFSCLTLSHSPTCSVSVRTLNMQTSNSCKIPTSL